jgi:hypothetical protein
MTHSVSILTLDIRLDEAFLADAVHLPAVVSTSASKPVAKHLESLMVATEVLTADL